MRKLLLAAASVGMTIGFGAASANADLEAYCVAYTEENAVDPSGCACIAETADESMAEELMAVQSQDDFANLSEDTTAAISQCWPDQG